MKIFLAGGGTGGAMSPLLAVAEQLKKEKPRTEFYLVGTGSDIERKMAEKSGLQMEHLKIPAGKFRRYFSAHNFFDVFKLMAGFLKSLYLLGKHKPDLVFGAGSFVQVPLVWAAYLRGIPAVIHQQDVKLGLAAKLASPVAKSVTMSFNLSARDMHEFSGLFKKIKQSKLVVTGNPVRPEIPGGSAEQANRIFKLTDKFPVLLVLGGSSGAKNLNDIVAEALPELVKYVQVIHVTGGKESDILKKFTHENYRRFDFLNDELKHAYERADMVLSRAGLSTITELGRLGKPSIIVPLPQSPQEFNAKFLALFKCAVVVTEETLAKGILVKLVRKILWDAELQKTMKTNISRLMPVDAAGNIARHLIKVYNKSRTK